MKKGLILVMGAVLLVAVMLSGCGWNDDDSDEDNGLLTNAEVRALIGSDSSQQTGLWVSGEGKVMAVPDIAVLTLGVEAQAATVSEAQGSAATAMTAVIAALRANNIADKDKYKGNDRT